MVVNTAFEDTQGNEFELHSHYDSGGSTARIYHGEMFVEFDRLSVSDYDEYETLWFYLNNDVCTNIRTPTGVGQELKDVLAEDASIEHHD